MSGHTPGPWYIIPAYTSAPAGVQNSGGEIIADVFCPKGFNPLVVMAEVESNAHLIAAAPELLAALKRFRAIMDRMNDSAQFEQLWYQLPPELLEASREAYNAVVKAEATNGR